MAKVTVQDLVDWIKTTLQGLFSNAPKNDQIFKDAEEMMEFYRHGVEVLQYQPGSWFRAKTVDQLQTFYMSRMPYIRRAASELGYAIGLHGSARRDLDLIAMAWHENAADKDTLAKAIQVAACGLSRDGPYEWETKPVGRVATSFAICLGDWANWHDTPGIGHIDLSLIEVSLVGSQGGTP